MERPLHVQLGRFLGRAARRAGVDPFGLARRHRASRPLAELVDELSTLVEAKGDLSSDPRFWKVVDELVQHPDRGRGADAPSALRDAAEKPDADEEVAGDGAAEERAPAKGKAAKGKAEKDGSEADGAEAEVTDEDEAK